MKTFAFVLCCVSFARLAAQDIQGFKTLRYEEDCKDISTDSIRSSHAFLKCLTLGPKDFYFSLGGSARYQAINVENEDWGDSPQSSDGYRLMRHMLHLDFHPGKDWRIFAELQSSLAFAKHDISALDENPLDLHQFFVDYRLSGTPSSNIIVRLGRQELLYGSQRLVSVRNGPNNRQAFDAIRLLYRSNSLNVDFLYSQFVIARPRSFNDVSGDALQFWSAYGMKRCMLFNFDLYYLGFYKTHAAYDDGTGRELRHSIGARISRKSDRFTLDFESLFQFGRLGKTSIGAWTLSLKSDYRIAGKLSPLFGLKTEIITGDKQYGDGKINTFNPLFPSGAYFGLAAMFGPANLIDFHPSLALPLARKIEWSFDYDIFWRHRVNDGIYTNNVRMIYSGRGNPYRFIGNQISTDVTYSPCAFFTINGEFKWFMTGEYLKMAGRGKDILFGIFSLELTF